MISSNMFLSLMVVGKCFVTQYAVKFVNILIFCESTFLIGYSAVQALLNFVLYLQAPFLGRFTSKSIFVLMV